MSIQIICDHCNQACSSHFQLTAWWTLDTTYGRPEQLDTRLKADYCTDCIKSLGPTINAELSRRAAYEQYLERNPQDNLLKALRKTVQRVVGITCDRCEQNCGNKFAKLSSSWLTEDGHVFYADVCPNCLEKMDLSLSKAIAPSQ